MNAVDTFKNVQYFVSLFIPREILIMYCYISIKMEFLRQSVERWNQNLIHYAKRPSQIIVNTMKKLATLEYNAGNCDF